MKTTQVEVNTQDAITSFTEPLDKSYKKLGKLSEGLEQAEDEFMMCYSAYIDALLNSNNNQGRL